MNPTTPTPDHPAAQVLAARQLAVLGQMLDVGLIRVNGLGRQAEIAMQEDAGRLTTGVWEAAYDRVTRSMRLTMVLQTRVLMGEPRAAETMAERQALARTRRLQAADLAQTVIAAEADNSEDHERLVEALERHLEYDRPEDYLDRPIEEIVAVICRGLGVDCDWDRWTASDAAAHDIFAAPAAVADADEPPAALSLARRPAADGPDAPLRPPAGARPILDGPSAPRRWPPPHRSAA